MRSRSCAADEEEIKEVFILRALPSCLNMTGGSGLLGNRDKRRLHAARANSNQRLLLEHTCTGVYKSKHSLFQRLAGTHQALMGVGSNSQRAGTEKVPRRCLEPP